MFGKILYDELVECTKVIYKDKFDVHFTDINSPSVIIHYPALTITNKHGDKYTITDLYAKIVFLKGRMFNVEVARTSFTDRAWDRGYIHSHASSDNPSHTFWRGLCIGSGTPLTKLLTKLGGGFNRTNYFKFLVQLQSVLTWENVSDTYIEMNGQWRNFLGSTAYSISQCTEEYTEVIKHFKLNPELLDQIVVYINNNIHVETASVRKVITSMNKFNHFIFRGSRAYRVSEAETSETAIKEIPGGFMFRGVSQVYTVNPSTEEVVHDPQYFKPHNNLVDRVQQKLSFYIADYLERNRLITTVKAKYLRKLILY